MVRPNRPRRLPARSAPSTPPVARKRHEAFASIAPGLEDALVDELAEIGIRARSAPGGAAFEAEPSAVYAVNLHSRLAARVTVQLGSFGSRSLEALASGVRGLPWSEYAWPGQPLEIRAALARSRLHLREPVEKKAANAIRDALRGPRIPGPRPPRAPVRVIVRIEDDRASVSVDASGELLHRRGWRRQTAKAPLRENLAAAVLRLAGWSPGEPLVDPMCGAGTFPIEAATVSLGMAPGARRAFAFQDWPCFDAEAWRVLEADVRTPEPLDAVAAISASDRDPGAIRATTDNARRAGVEARIRIRACEFGDLEPPDRAGLLVANPPYGARMGGGARTSRIWEGIGRALRERWVGWRVALLVPGRRHYGALGLELEEITSFSNGGIGVVLYAGTIG